MIKLTLPDGTFNRYRQDRNGTHEVYEHIADFLNPEYAKGDTNALTQEQHLIAADAEGWCELACEGDFYEDQRIPGLSISIKEEL